MSSDSSAWGSGSTIWSAPSFSFSDIPDSAPFISKPCTLGKKLVPLTLEPHELTPFRKDFYTEHPEVLSRSSAEIQQSRSDSNIFVPDYSGRPISLFSHLDLPDFLRANIEAAGFSKPTPIQAEALPIAISGKDIVGIAQTGSGKTLAFIIPALIHIHDQPPVKPGEGPIGLVLSPTRELALQISEEISKFSKSSGMRHACIYGGAPKVPQLNELSRGVSFLVATPGRLIDYLENRDIALKRVTYLVLDEADKMLDMGFEPQIRAILGQVRPDRQTLMFSATWPREVQNMARDFLCNPIQVRIGSLEVAANANIRQIIEFVEDSQKLSLLSRGLKGVLKDGTKVIIFTETKRKCDSLYRDLSDQGISCAPIHGDKTQFEREKVLRNFKQGIIKILIATDVASRGLDVKDINYVINYDLPKNIEDYIHRIGRTARAGARGTAVSFFSPSDVRLATNLIDVLKQAKHEVPERLYSIKSQVAMREGRRNASRSPRRRF